MFTLLNKRNNRRLIHPQIGVWCCADIEQAKEMLEACKQYLSASNLSVLASDFVIVEMETGKEIDA